MSTSARTPRTAARKTPSASAPTARPAKPVPAAATPAPAAPGKKGKATPKPDSPVATKAPAPSKPAPSKRAETKPAETKPPKKPKAVLVRDGFTMPEADFALISQLKKRAAAAGRETKKSEVLRAGLQVLAALETPALLAALSGLAPVKIGRPRKGH